MPKNEPFIIALSGQKGAGKNSLATFIAQYYYILGQTKTKMDPFNVEEFAFADGIKDFCIDILGLEHKQCHGSDEEKNTPTKYKWDDTPEGLMAVGTPRLPDGVECKTGYMTGRDVMQIFGTECVRNWFGNVWAEATVRKILKEIWGLAIVTDNRFPNEVEITLEQPKGYIIRLTRSPFIGTDLHPSETALDDFNWDRKKCFVLDNAQMTKAGQNNAVTSILETIFQQGA